MKNVAKRSGFFKSKCISFYFVGNKCIACMVGGGVCVTRPLCVSGTSTQVLGNDRYGTNES